MRPTFIPRLVNGPFEDPALFVPMAFHRRALLFDLGDLSALSPGDLLKVTHVFVSHTHMDHFIGFDQLLRILLGREKSLHLFGPHGFLDNVMGRLKAYTWNLVRNYQECLNITATEIDIQKYTTRSFNCQEGFISSPPVTEILDSAFIYREPGFTVNTAILDHRIPSLAFAIKERFHVNILKPRLAEMGLTVGPWISRFKELLAKQAAPSTKIEAKHRDATARPVVFTIGELASKIARITPGQKIAYVADALFSEENEKKIVDLVYQADHLFIEAAFAEKDRITAREKYHLTAHQAGFLARKAKVREMSIFHHSPRYLDQKDLLEKEAQKAFRGGEANVAIGPKQC